MRVERFVLILSILLTPVTLFAQNKTTSASADAGVREAIRQYDEALRKGDAAGAEKFWAEEYTFINPRGERLTRADRLKNMKSGQTAFNSLEHTPKEDEIKLYGNGDVAVYTTLLEITGQYGGEKQQGSLWGTVVWIRRDGRWQQISSQVTPVLGH